MDETYSQLKIMFRFRKIIIKKYEMKSIRIKFIVSSIRRTNCMSALECHGTITKWILLKECIVVALRYPEILTEIRIVFLTENSQIYIVWVHVAQCLTEV